MEPIYSNMHPSTGKIIRPNNQTWDLFELVDNSNPADRKWKVSGTFTATVANAFTFIDWLGNIVPMEKYFPGYNPPGKPSLRGLVALGFSEEFNQLETFRIFHTGDHGHAQVVFPGYNDATGVFDMLNIYTESAVPTVEPNGLGSIMWDEDNNQLRILRAKKHPATGVAQMTYGAWDFGNSAPGLVPVYPDNWGWGTGGLGLLVKGFKGNMGVIQSFQIDDMDNLKVQDFSNKTAPAVYNITLTQNVIVTVPISFLFPGRVKAFRMRIRGETTVWQLGYDAALATYETMPEDEVLVEERLRTPGFNAYVRQTGVPSAVLELTMWS